MAHKHSIYDTDPHFSIDPITREIENKSGKVTIIQHDHNSERFTFEIPREIDGHDMSLCNKVEVHYINIDASTKEKYADIHKVDDLQISPDGDDVVICSWLLSGNATQYAGNLSFVIRFACMAEDGVTIDYAWHTAPYTEISVSGGIYNSETVVTEYADVLEQWLQKAGGVGQATAAGGEILNDTERNLAEAENATARGTKTLAIGTASYAEGRGERGTENEYGTFNVNAEITAVSGNVITATIGSAVGLMLSNMAGNFIPNGFVVRAGSQYFPVVNLTYTAGLLKYTIQLTCDVASLDESLVGQSITEIYGGVAYGDFSHVGGSRCVAKGENSFAHGNMNYAGGGNAVALGYKTKATGGHAIAGGYETNVSGTAAMAVGKKNTVSGIYSFSAGMYNTVTGNNSAAVGQYNTTENQLTFVANSDNVARANCATVLGHHNFSAKQLDDEGNALAGSPGYAQTVVGKYNAYENGEIDKALFVVGNGNSATRSNAFMVNKDGSATVAGQLKFGSIDKASANKVRGIRGGIEDPTEKGDFTGQLWITSDGISAAFLVWVDAMSAWIDIKTGNITQITS